MSLPGFSSSENPTALKMERAALVVAVLISAAGSLARGFTAALLHSIFSFVAGVGQLGEAQRSKAILTCRDWLETKRRRELLMPRRDQEPEGRGLVVPSASRVTVNATCRGCLAWCPLLVLFL